MEHSLKKSAPYLFDHAGKLIEAYHTMLQPLCRKLNLPVLAVDILLYFANHPDNNTAGELCRFRGLKQGIVSVHVETLVKEGYLVRQPVLGDRRKIRLVCTERAERVADEGRRLQNEFGARLVEGIPPKQLDTFYHCLKIIDDHIAEINSTRSNASITSDQTGDLYD